MTLPRPLNGSMNCIGGCGGTPEVRDAGDAHILNLHLMSGVDTLTDGFAVPESGLPVPGTLSTLP